MGYVILSLTPARVADIERAIDSKITFNGYKGIVHVQIGLSGRSHSLHATSERRTTNLEQGGYGP